MAREREYGWAAFNIESDGNQFDFPVALGGTVSGLRKPDSTVVVLHQLDDYPMCRVSLQPVRRSPRRTRSAAHLEVFAPLLKHDHIELDVTAECVSQLTRALKLYRPIPFWITPCYGRKLPVQPQFDGADTVYRLTGGELRAFLSFARRLLSLHVSRNLFDHARYLPKDMEDDVRALLGGSRSGEKHMLETEAYLLIATSLFDDASRSSTAAREHQLMLLMMAAEALFSDDNKSEIAYRLAHRMALLNGSDDHDRLRLFEAVRAFYKKRSNLVHGSWYQKKEIVSVSDDDVDVLRNLLRASILYFFALRGKNKKAVLDTLDAAIFDRNELQAMREKVNEYWGLSGSDERLHASSWLD